METKGKKLIKQVNSLTKECQYNNTQVKNLETMIKHMDENLQMIVDENIQLRQNFNEKMTKKNEEILEMKGIARRIIEQGDMELFNQLLAEGQKNIQISREKNKDRQIKIANDNTSSNPSTTRNERNGSLSRRGSSQSKVTQKVKRSPRTVSKEENAHLIIRIAELKRENEQLRQQNSQIREKWLQNSITQSSLEKNQLLLPNVPRISTTDDDSIFFDEQTPVGSLIDSQMQYDEPYSQKNRLNSKQKIYEDVKNKQKLGFKFGWKKNNKDGNKLTQKQTIAEAEESISRTTLRKTLGATGKNSARGRHSKYTGEEQNDVYCNLI